MSSFLLQLYILIQVDSFLTVTLYFSQILVFLFSPRDTMTLSCGKLLQRNVSQTSLIPLSKRILIKLTTLIYLCITHSRSNFQAVPEEISMFIVSFLGYLYTCRKLYRKHISCTCSLLYILHNILKIFLHVQEF